MNGFRRDAGGPHQEKHDEPMPSPAQGPDSTCAHFQLLGLVGCKHEVALRMLCMYTTVKYVRAHAFFALSV